MRIMMKSYILVLLVFVSISNCKHQTSGFSISDVSSDKSDGYDYDSGDDESSEGTTSRIENYYSNTTDNRLPTSPFDEVTTLPPPTKSPTELKCPQNCKCSALHKRITLVDCSHQNLREIPKNLPQSVVYLNLSHNSLTTLNVSDLINCSELRLLYLNNNQIKKIANAEDFAKLPSLHHIDLSINAFKPLRGSEFSKARELTTLLLSGNKDIAASNVPIIQTDKLKTLYLTNCSINKLSENIFRNLSSLVALNLDNNPLNLTHGVSAFKHLTSLRRLFIPTVPQNIALDLCKNLQVIDIINLSLENHDISCYLLSRSSTYEESTIRTDLFRIPTDPPLNSTIVEISSITNMPTDAITIESQTTYEKMSMMYMILTGLVLILIVAILSVFCIIGSRQLGLEVLYRKQNYRKYFAGNLTVENPNYETYLIECEKTQFDNV